MGTLGHELGHFLAATWSGCEPVLHYQSVSPGCAATGISPTLRLLGVAAGPISSVLTGSIGMVLLARWRRRHPRLDLTGVTLTIVALFWSRPLFNLFVHVGGLAVGALSWSAVGRSDEARLSTALGLPVFTVGGGSAVLAAAVCAWTALQVPAPDRASWGVGAVVGSLVGFAVWMAVLGPAWLP